MAKIIKPLTVAEVTKAIVAVGAAANASRLELRDGATPGLRLRVGPRGGTWDLTLMAGGKRVSFPLGAYPDVSLAHAREAAQRKRKTVLEAQIGVSGLDGDGSAPTTLNELINYYGAARGGQLRTWKVMTQSITRVFADLLNESLFKLAPRSIQHAADFYPAKNYAAHAMKSLRPVLKFGHKRGLILFQPSLLEMPAHNRTPRDRVLSNEELTAVFRALGNTTYDDAIRLLFLTACRKSEVTEARWNEIDLDRGIWTIPATRTKEKRQHVVQLSRAAQDVIRRQKRVNDYLFTKPPINWDRYQKQLHARSGTSNWHRHDIRRTSATNLGRLDYAPPLIEAILGHKDLYSPLATIYQAHRYDDQAREALEALSQFYASLA